MNYYQLFIYIFIVIIHTYTINYRSQKKGKKDYYSYLY